MDLNTLQAMPSAGFASLFLILLPCAFLAPRPVAQGIRIPVVRIHHVPDRDYTCEKSRVIFPRLTKDGKTWINDSEIPGDRLDAKIAEIMEYRAERVAYVLADSEVSVQQFAGFVDGLKKAVPDLHIIVISGDVRRRLIQSREQYFREVDAGRVPVGEPLSECDFAFPPPMSSRSRLYFVCPGA